LGFYWGVGGFEDRSFAGFIKGFFLIIFGSCGAMENSEFFLLKLLKKGSF
jgi:hypothetical protein